VEHIARVFKVGKKLFVTVIRKDRMEKNIFCWKLHSETLRKILSDELHHLHALSVLSKVKAKR